MRPDSRKVLKYVHFTINRIEFHQQHFESAVEFS